MKWLWLSALVVVLDQATKQLATAHLILHKPVEVVPMLNFTLMYNSGAAFSFLSDAGGWQRWFFVTIALAVSIGIVIWLARLKREQTWLAVGLALILGGALGNVWDRMLLGHVVDFIDVYYQQWHWPAFNIADAAITVGAVLLIIDSWRPQPGVADERG